MAYSTGIVKRGLVWGLGVLFSVSPTLAKVLAHCVSRVWPGFRKA
jgi:hypothetical protein